MKSTQTSQGAVVPGKSSTPCTLQHQCACGKHTEKQLCKNCKQDATFVQHNRGGLVGSRMAPPIVHEVLQSAGQPLEQETRAWAEPLFGRDFSHVRVHTNARAAESAQSVNTLAYTVGQDMVFGSSRYSPMTRTGRKLLVHELAHTIQQQNSAGPPIQQTKLEVSRPGDAAEREAEAVAKQAVAGLPVRVEERASSIVHRLSKETWGNISLGLGAASAVAGGIALATGHGTLGAVGLGVGAAGIITGLALRSKHKPLPSSIRLAQIHQFPLDENDVAGGLRTGIGGIAEMEVSNGSVDYDNSEISERFVGGDCQNTRGVGGRKGSTFTVGYGFTDHTFPSKIHMPAKHNVFYDMHSCAALQSGPTPRPCAQQYTFDGQVIAGKTFVRSYDRRPATIAGENVTICALNITEQGPAQPPAQPSTGQHTATRPAIQQPAAAQPAAPQGN
jgi:hypothetical protein